MAPSEAERLNVEQARFYLSDEKTVKAYCQRVSRRCRENAGGVVKSKADIMEDAKRYIANLREYYTGKATL